MRCKDFDAQIEELLSGVLHPDANQHMRQCERCTSYFRARSTVQSGLRALASAPAQGPSRATDRAVMESYRRVLQGRSQAQPNPAQPMPRARVVAFPGRGGASSPAARSRWSGLAVAAALLAMVGSGVHLWLGAPTVTAPSVVAPAVAQSPVAASPAADDNTAAANNVLRHSSRQLQARLGRASRPAASETAAEPMLAAKAAVPAAAVADGASEQSVAVSANSIMHLASTGGSAQANGVAQSASSTWPGYSNLMYCDPVVCSGPMQVVHIKVPVGQGKPNAGPGESKGFVNAEVVVGPDGVARAIRVAN
jgi:hypothetical protein